MYQSPHMIQYDGSIDAKWILLFLLFFLVSLISACGGNEAIDSQQVEAEPEEPSLTAREWYPTSKYQQQALQLYRQVYQKIYESLRPLHHEIYRLQHDS